MGASTSSPLSSTTALLEFDIFPKVLDLLGQYDAVSLFEDDNLETARDDLIRMVDAGGVKRLFEA